MYLKQLHISNFRCFRNFSIEFAPGVTVLFGKNGSGKSTLIHAIHKALSFLMYSEEVKVKASKEKKAKVVDVKTFRLNNPYPTVEGFSFYDCEYEGAKPYDYEININAQAEFEGGFPLEWNMTGVAPKMSLRKSGYRSQFLELYEWIKNSDLSPSLPLLAYYSDGFPHNTILNKNKSSEKTKRDLHLKYDYPELGYTDWNSDKGFTNVWLERLINKLRRLDTIPREYEIYKVSFEAGKIEKEVYDNYIIKSEKELSDCKNEVDKITGCLQKFSEGDDKLEVISLSLDIHDITKVCIVDSHMKRHAFSVLPAGYKRMFYIALDIAYRSYMLSQGQSTNIPGVAIIDEIDLHLHPELEQTVLQRFMRTFTNVQFIVSTHSPLVLTGIETKCKRNSILKLNPLYNAPEEWPNIHGIDYNQMLEENMGVSKREPKTDKLFKTIWDEVAKKDTEAAKKTMKELESITPKDQKELVQLRALISRLEIIGK